MSKKRKRQRKSGRSASSLADHQKTGKTLTPPLMRHPITLSAWSDHRLPEMLWACLLLTTLPRRQVIGMMRRIATAALDWSNETPEKPKDLGITHSALPDLPQELRTKVMAIICNQSAARRALAPLLLFPELPGYSIWQESLDGLDIEPTWPPLMRAIARTLYHQSQEATDARWMKVFFSISVDQLKLSSKEMVTEIAGYPDYGDLHKVRPMIRASEGSTAGLETFEGRSTNWPTTFWTKCLDETPCIERTSTQSAPVIPPIGTTPEQIATVRNDLIEHFFATLDTTATDPRHDTSFGTALYSLSILEELVRIGITTSIMARFALRALLECTITLIYLAHKDGLDLWKSHRVYGAGQAKLALLKLEENEGTAEYVTLEELEELANDDAWEEFVEINLGHWHRSTLLRMAEEAGVRSLYDRYYPWTSAYLHGHWSAIRDSTFQHCMNPLHRLHRIPRASARPLSDLLVDACAIVDETLSVLANLYPPFVPRVSLRS